MGLRQRLWSRWIQLCRQPSCSASLCVHQYSIPNCLSSWEMGFFNIQESLSNTSVKKVSRSNHSHFSWGLHHAVRMEDAASSSVFLPKYLQGAYSGPKCSIRERSTSQCFASPYTLSQRQWSGQPVLPLHVTPADSSKLKCHDRHVPGGCHIRRLG